MTLDSRVQKLLKFAALRPNDLTQPMSVRRTQSNAVSAKGAKLVMRMGPNPAREVEYSVPVDGGRIRVRCLVPHGPGPHPLYVFIHGGGWCAGTIEEREGRCRMVSDGARCVVASVDYRLAPENQFPTAPLDCFAALNFLVDHAEELNLDVTRIAVGGESAGGNLAAALCLLARDRGGPEIMYQWLDVPALDCTLSQEGHRNVPDGYLLDAAAIDDYLESYIDDPAEYTNPLASPLLAEDLSGLPPAWIMTVGYDRLRGDGAAYADALIAAGVDARHTRLDGHIHVSFAFTRLVPSAAAYEDRAIVALADAFRLAKVRVGSSAS
ncbi:MAG: alpha/beta hydrolase [Microthrixaceae bacterium]|nr:alpha/beta hydrolase [Microthrixaceae bacterium]MCO5313660.1 alpha/beta hydrolase [Microthrixaceae bacterium]HPB45677.1 alpha/beta hydrolase [Microthrixaceae bacterium]